MYTASEVVAIIKDAFITAGEVRDTSFIQPFTTDGSAALVQSNHGSLENPQSVWG